MSESVDTTDSDDPRTPSGEEAVEQCPICKCNNSPGACDSCEHFFASCWDGDIIWNRTYEYDYPGVGGLIWEVDAIRKANPESAEKLFEELGKKHQMPEGWLDDVDQELSKMEFLEKHNDFAYGKTITTGGMLSGSGYSIYHENPDEVEEFMKKVIRFAKDLESHVPPSEETK